MFLSEHLVICKNRNGVLVVVQYTKIWTGLDGPIGLNLNDWILSLSNPTSTNSQHHKIWTVLVCGMIVSSTSRNNSSPSSLTSHTVMGRRHKHWLQFMLCVLPLSWVLKVLFFAGSNRVQISAFNSSLVCFVSNGHLLDGSEVASPVLYRF